MSNLLKETLEILKDNNKSLDDVLWIGSNDSYYDLEDNVLKIDTLY